MQRKTDTHGYIIRGLRRAARSVAECVNRHELYFVYFNRNTQTVTVNEPAHSDPDHILLIESGYYKLSQQDIANLAIRAIELEKTRLTL